ncbi:MAG: LamG domain-containing protein [Planctomycetes bacterium]|nr:LamG domain-containing protein [Planctomycetota bacterium]
MHTRFAGTSPWLAIWLCLLVDVAGAQEPTLLAHWMLAGDPRDSSGSERHLTAHGVEWSAGPSGIPATAATFDGRDDFLELPASSAPALRASDFSFSLWVYTDAELDDVLGDLANQYDSGTLRGWQISIQNLAGVTSSQPNYRQVHFGIDQGRLEPLWADHGRVGQGVFVFALAVHDGELYASTCEPAVGQRGHVYRWRGEAGWQDMGAPDACNSISSLASYGGSLYAGSSKYRLAGSALPESQNPHFGGKVFRLRGAADWEHVGTLPAVEAIGSLVVYRGKLYASSMYKPGGLFRYDGGTTWTACGTPDGKRVESLAVYNGSLWATGYDEAGIYRYDGEKWEHTGNAGAGRQTYALAVHRGALFASQWPEAKVFRYVEDGNWQSVGRLGSELESMPLLVYNGKLYGGTLPLAEVYRFDGVEKWTKVGRLDHTPNAKYRRAWSMAVFQGRLFCGTLPSGRVHSIEAGRNVTYDRELVPGWRHITAVRRGNRLELYIDGEPVARSAEFRPEDYDLTVTQPLRIGFGAHDYFRGRIADIRLYQGALDPQAIRATYEQGFR